MELVTWDEPGIARLVIEPTLSSMLSDAERASARSELREGPPPGRWTFEMSFPHDHFSCYVYQHPEMAEWTLTEVRSHFANDLQDFIAESTFGWGQLRALPSWQDDEAP